MIWLVVLATLLLAEYELMAWLPELLPAGAGRLFTGAADSIFLTTMAAPLLWWVVVRPLQRLAALRDQYLSDLFEAMEADRRRLAQELHDGIGQSLSVVVSGLRSLPMQPDSEQAMRQVAELEILAKQSLQELRRVARGLRPSLLDDLGLAAAIERTLAEAQSQLPMAIGWELPPPSGTRLPPAVETGLFRIFQEALNNCVKHSGADEIHVQLSLKHGLAVLEIADNGHGLQPPLALGKPQAQGRLGLHGMYERAALLGGDLRIESSKQGTKVTAKIPWTDVNVKQDTRAVGGRSHRAPSRVATSHQP